MMENEKKYIDLHVHSTASDGTFTPSQLVEYAMKKNLYAFALTDHDTVDGIDEAKKTAEGRINVIPGIEMAADYNGIELHILGLNIDYKNQEFTKHINQCKKLRAERNQKMIERMNEQGFPITAEIISDRYGAGNSVTRAHFARYLLDEGYVLTKEEAFDRYLGRGCACYVPRTLMKPDRVVEVIKRAGGHPVLAHPLLYKLSKERIYSLVNYLKSMGLEGIEAIYSLNSSEDDEFLAGVAKRYGLYVTGGSDFHGSNKPDIDLGTGKGNLAIPKYLLANLQIFDNSHF